MNSRYITNPRSICRQLRFAGDFMTPAGDRLQPRRSPITADEKPPELLIRSCLESLGILLLSEWDVLAFVCRHRTSLASAKRIACLIGYESTVVRNALYRLDGRSSSRVREFLKEYVFIEFRILPTQRMFVDGIGLLNPNMGIGNSVNVEYRESLQRLFESLQRESLTAIFSLEEGRGPDSISTVEMTDFIADTVIQLGRERCGWRMKRSIEILKSRGQDYDAGEHTL